MRETYAVRSQRIDFLMTIFLRFHADRSVHFTGGEKWRVFFLAWVLSMSAAVEAAQRPNILFIYTDDQSHRTVSCYEEAYPWVKTPNIDALAADGVRFTHAYVGTWCMP
ncbi:MAG: sulfatase-like hydrolase/transferase, partial [Verrucomicrobiota bacterium]